MIIEQLDQSIQKVLGHTKRMNDGRFTNRVCKVEVEEARGNGRSKRGWNEGLKELD